MYRSVLAMLAVCIALAAPHQAFCADQQLVSMLRLISRSPGGSASLPLPLALYAEQGFYFDLGISDQLGSAAFEDYLERRLQLLTASYSVQIVDYGPVENYLAGAAGEPWTSVQSPEGRFRLPGSLLPGHVYAWHATALVDDGGGNLFTVQSEPLYFHTARYDALLAGGGLHSAADLSFVNGLNLIGQLQHSESLSISHRLQGSNDYVNYPVETDSYVCSSINPAGSHPLPPRRAGALELPELLELGRIMRDARELQSWLVAGRDPLGQLNSLASQSQLFVNALERRDASASELSGNLREVARRIGLEETLTDPQRQALLSEMLLLGDQLASTGSVALDGNVLETFATYCSSSDLRLRQLSDMDPALYNLLGASRGMFWQEYFRSQRADLVLLREEIRNGLVEGSRLPALLSQARERAGIGLAGAFDGTEQQQYADALSAFAKLAPAGATVEQTVTLLEAQLSWIAAGIWPDVD